MPLGNYTYGHLVQQKDVPRPRLETPTTWDGLFALCDKIKQPDIAPMAFQGRYPYYALRNLYETTYYHLAGPEVWKNRPVARAGHFSTTRPGYRAIENCVRSSR